MLNYPAFSSSDPPTYNDDPLSLHATYDPSAQLVSPKFNGTNFLRWSRAMHIALSANNKLGFIDGTIPKPSLSSSTYNQWLRCDCIVMSWIINSIQPQLSDTFLYASSAKQLWDDIQHKFGVSSGHLLYQLERQITDTVQGDSPLAVYYITLDKLWDEFASFFPFPTSSDERLVEYEQRRKLIKFLMGLNDGFDSVRAQILMMDPLPTSDTAFSMLFQVEKQRQIMHDTSAVSDSESEAVHVIKSSLNSYDVGYAPMKKSRRYKRNPNVGDIEPDQDLINAVVQSVVQILKQKHGVESTIPPQLETSHLKLTGCTESGTGTQMGTGTARTNECDKQQDQEQKREQTSVENSYVDTDMTINHADPSPDLHKDDNQASLADPFSAASSDHNQTTTIEHTISPSPASSNQTTTSAHTVSQSSTTTTKTKTKKKKVVLSDVNTLETILVTKKIGSYTSSQKILLVGEGDFSFSTCLAVAFGSASNMVATSLNTKEFLLQNYANFSANEKELGTRGCKVLHGIDATKMATHSQLSSMKFHRIIFNFPHSGFRSEEKSTNAEMGRHQTLVSGFLRNAKEMIEKNGQIHIRHKCNDPFLKWNIPKLGLDQGLSLVAESPFKRSKFPGYHTKYGFGGDKDFDCDPSKTYMFRLAS